MKKHLDNALAEYRAISDELGTLKAQVSMALSCLDIGDVERAKKILSHNAEVEK